MKYQRSLLNIITLFIALPFSATGQTNPLIQEMVASVSRSQLMNNITSLQSFGTRYEYSPQQDSAAEFLFKTLSGWGLQPESDWYVFGTGTLRDIDMVDRTTGWMVGSSGTLLSTSDGGQHWTGHTGYTQTLNGVDFIDFQCGWAVGANIILRTANGGTSWISQESPFSTTLNCVKFFDVNTGIAGGSGILLRTTNGGITWNIITWSSELTYYDIDILDGTTAYILSTTGALLKSTDEGTTWITIPSPTPNTSSNTFLGVDFINATTGWVTGSPQLLYKTTDGGTTWQKQNPPSEFTGSLACVRFANFSIGWATGSSGIALTTDGGTSWKSARRSYNLGWGPTFYKVNVISPSSAMVSGGRGVILLTNDTGKTWINQTGNLPSGITHRTRNIVATIPGKITPDRECILVAHYDSYSNSPMVAAPGANDNASGTSAIMEAARVCRNFEFESTLRFVAVSMEESGMYGSDYYGGVVQHQHRTITGVINADMIGYPTTPDTCRIVVASYLTRNKLVDSAFSINQRYAIGLNFTASVDHTGASDYGPFAIRGYDAIDFSEGTPEDIWGGKDPYYHGTNDTVDKLHSGMIHRTAQIMTAMAAEIAKPVRRITRAPEIDKIPSALLLNQNYPNPFNPTTKIEYALPEAGYVTLKIFNSLGQEVKVLVNGFEQPGHRFVVFDASALNSGVYFYRLNVGGLSSAKKMILKK